MKSIILIDENIETVKTALIEDGRLAEFHVSGAAAQRLTGNIYKGRVENVLPGMQAAFVAYGAEKNGYLSADDILFDKAELSGIGNEVALPPLSSLTTGAEIMVQIVKDENGAKGARLSQVITLAGRFIVLLPNLDFIGISRKIEDESIRARLAQAVIKAAGRSCGVIIRTAAEDAPSKEILHEIKLLWQRWAEIKKAYAAAKPLTEVHSEGGLAYGFLRDTLNDTIQKIEVYGAAAFNVLKKQMSDGVLNKYVKRLERYTGGEELFDRYGVNAQLEALLEKRVNLKNKAYLIIERTEAMTVIDVNTGSFTGGESLEQTALETNLTAAEEIARQLRLRNTGGIIVIDFIDMALKEHKDAVVDYLKKCLKKDGTKTQVLGMTALGLVEMTRKKRSREASAYLEQGCPYCSGLGRLYSVSAIVDKIRAALKKIMADINPGAAVLTVNPQAADAIFNSRSLTSLCEKEWQGKRIYIVPDEKMHVHAYKIRVDNKTVLDLPPKAMLLY